MLSGKFCVITGAASGIGSAIAKTFLAQGARVAAVDIEAVSGLPQSDNLSTHVCDVSRVSSISSISSSPPRVLVNAAGITRDKLLIKLTEQHFDEVINVNLKGTFLMCQLFAKLLIDGVGSGDHQAGASIVNIASIVGKTGNIGQVNYAASKAGVEGLTRSVARELARYQIRCNAILPGYITTPMTAKVPDAVAEAVKDFIPLNRFGDPQEVANVASFLASDLSSYITGASIEVTGGLGM